MKDLTTRHNTDLQRAWRELRRTSPNLRPYDAAARLGVAESQLLATRCGGGVVRLRGSWADILRGAGRLGVVKTITRNRYAVHETVGKYDGLRFIQDNALVMAEGLDLRLILNSWGAAFAVRDRVGATERRSIQFFDTAGVAVHKIYPQGDDANSAFDEIATSFADADQGLDQPVGAVATSAVTRSECGSGDALLEGWSKLVDTHEFAPMLERLDIERATAMRIAEGRFTTRLEISALERMLELARDRSVPIMAFVENRGAVQIYTGKVARVENIGGWLNVLAPDFNLHLRMDLTGDVWAVRKPTVDGDVTSVETYAADGTNIVTFFGARKPGVPELSEWRSIVSDLEEVAS